MKNCPSFVFLLCFLIPSANASENISQMFELDFYQGGGDIPKVFKNTSGIIEGHYISRVSLNGKYIGSREFLISKQEEKEDKLCLIKSFISSIGLSLKDSTVEKVTVTDGRNCLDLMRLEFADVKFNLSDQSLSISVPQVYLNEQSVSSNSDYGIGGARVQYYIQSVLNDEGNRSLYGQFNGKVNVGNWIINSDFSGSWVDSESDTHLSNLYAQLALPSIKSDLIVGKSHTNGNLIDGFAFGGIGLRSNQQMEQIGTGYIPDIRGVVSTTSRITVKQHGRIVYAETVSPGPYHLKNFQTVGTGDLSVEVKGNDGSVDVKVYPLMKLPTLMRPDYFDFSLYAGKRYEGDGVDGLFDSDREFIAFNGQYGFQAFTLEGALLVDQKYQGIGLGTTFYLAEFGTLAIDGGLSFADYDNGESLNGASVGVKYAYQMSSRTNLQLAAYKYQNADYVSYSSFYPEQTSSSRARQKGRFEAILSRIENRYNIGLMAWQQDYWDVSHIDSGVSANVSGMLYENISWALNLAYSKNNNVEDVSTGLTLSVPVDFGKNSHYLSGSVTNSKRAGTSMSASASGALSDRSNYSMSVGDMGTNLNANYSFDAVETNAGLSYYDGHSTLRAGISGTALWTVPSGLMLSRLRNDTIGVVDTNGIADMTVNGSTSNDNGFALVSLNPYTDNKLNVNVASVPLGVEIDTQIQTVKPTEGAILHRKIKAERVNRYIAIIKNTSGVILTSGDVEAEGVFLGSIAPNGMIVFSAPNAVKQVKVNFNDTSRQCQMDLSAIVPNTKKVHEVICE